MTVRPAAPLGVKAAAAWDLAISFGRLDAARRRLDQAARLRAADRRLMWLLSDGVARTLREIADGLGLEQSTVNRQVNAALAEGLLARSREHGRTAWLITATAEGLSRFRHDLDRNLGAYDEALGAMSERDAARLTELLARYADQYRAVIDRRD